MKISQRILRNAHLPLTPMFIHTIFLAVLGILLKSCAKSVPGANIVVFYSSTGVYSNVADPYFLGTFWQANLWNKLANDPNWPFNATLEYFDLKSDTALVSNFCNARFVSNKLPNVTAVIGPFGTPVGYAVSGIAVKYNIPVIFYGVVAYATTNGVVNLLPSLSTSFFILPPGFTFTTSTVIDTYVKVGVKTMFVVYLSSPLYSTPKSACSAALTVASKRGIQVIKTLTYTPTNSTDDLYNIVLTIKNANPDVVVWCDTLSCLVANRIQYHPLPLFKRANYLPKALTLSDCLDSPLTADYYNQGLYQFVSAAQSYNAKASGPDYTEDFTSFSSVFRPKTPAVLTVSFANTVCQSKSQT